MSSILTNLMFGNINQNGELEDDSFLDQVSLFNAYNTAIVTLSSEMTTKFVLGNAHLFSYQGIHGLFYLLYIKIFL